ncbi:MAG: hypothetical protein ACKOL0_03000 [Solirubrobacterales bacterium]
MEASPADRSEESEGAVPDSSKVWFTWLTVVTLGVIVFGLFLLTAPGLARQWFSVLVYSSAEEISGFGPAAVAYIELAHAVMGAVMVGWGVALLLVLRGPMKRNLTEGLKIFAISLVAWFIPDTVFSIASGFWENAVQNVVFAVLFAVPLIALFRQDRLPRLA